MEHNWQFQVIKFSWVGQSTTPPPLHLEKSKRTATFFRKPSLRPNVIEKNILNFHFDYWIISLNESVSLHEVLLEYCRYYDSTIVPTCDLFRLWPLLCIRLNPSRTRSDPQFLKSPRSSSWQIMRWNCTLCSVHCAGALHSSQENLST